MQTASDEATTLGRQYQEAHRRLHGYMDERGLLYERGHLNERQPRLYEPDGTPKQSESAAGRLQAEIDKTPDLADLAQRAEHARRLERHAKQAVHAFVADKIDQVLDGLRPEGEVIAAGVNERLGKSVPELGNYLGFIQYVSSLVAAARQSLGPSRGWLRQRHLSGRWGGPSYPPRSGKTREARPRPGAAAITRPI